MLYPSILLYLFDFWFKIVSIFRQFQKQMFRQSKVSIFINLASPIAQVNPFLISLMIEGRIPLVFFTILSIIAGLIYGISRSSLISCFLYHFWIAALLPQYLERVKLWFKNDFLFASVLWKFLRFKNSSLQKFLRLITEQNRTNRATYLTPYLILYAHNFRRDTLPFSLIKNTNTKWVELKALDIWEWRQQTCDIWLWYLVGKHYYSIISPMAGSLSWLR